MTLDTQSTWSCDAQGFPAQTGNAVGSVDFWQCVNAQKPAPKFPVCAMSSTGAYCASCMMQQCPEQALACGKSAECKAINSCLTSCDTSGDGASLAACVGKCKSKHAAGVAAFEQMDACWSGLTHDGAGCNPQCANDGNLKHFVYKDASDVSTEVAAFKECNGMFP